MAKDHAYNLSSYPIRAILNVPIRAIELKKIPDVIESLIEHGYQETFYYVNAHCLNISVKNSQYRHILNKASLVYSGGLGPVLASKLLNQPLPERTPTPDFIDKVFSTAQKRNWSIYLLGTKQASLKLAIQKIKTKFPKLEICGYHHGYFNEAENRKIINEINELKPTLVIVGMGTPKQETWMDENSGKLNVKAIWAVGALFDVISGALPRAPICLQKAGLEWFFRLCQEPQRLWARYLIGNAMFLIVVFLSLFSNGKILPQKPEFVAKLT